jgi:hypothetical protein
VVIEKKERRMSLLNLLNMEGELMFPPLHPYVFTRQEFFEMLVNKEENYGKEIIRKHLALSGAESYYMILRDAMNYGLRGETIS